MQVAQSAKRKGSILGGFIATQKPIYRLAEFLRKPDECLRCRRKLPSLDFGKLALADPQAPGKFLLEHLAPELANTPSDRSQIQFFRGLPSHQSFS